MTHPSEYYVRFLLAECWGDPDHPLQFELLSETLRSYGLLEITEVGFSLIQKSFEPGDEFRFNNRKHKPTADFMRAERIHKMWRPDEHMTRVLDELLGVNLVTDIIHILLMGDVPAKVIAHLVNKRFRLNPAITAEMVELYHHYFWNVPTLNYAQWEDSLMYHPHKDAYLASLLCGDQQAMFRAGFNPRYDFKQALRDTHRQVTFRIQYLATKPDDKQTINNLIKLSREERALYQRMWSEGGGIKEEAKRVKEFLMEHKIPDVKRLDEFIEEQGSISDDGSVDDSPDEADQDEDEE